MKRAIRIFGIILAALIVIALALPFLIDANQFRPRLETELGKALGREVKLGDLKLSILSGAVTATDLSISDDPAFSKVPFLSAQSLAVGVDLPALIFSKKLTVTGIEIQRPEIALLESSAGTWNFSSLGGKSSAPKPAESPGATAPLDLSVKLVKVTGGRVSLRRRGESSPQTLDKVNIEIRDFAADASFPFSFSGTIQGGGDVTLAGKAGPIDTKDVAATPFSANLKLNKLDIVHTGFVPAATGFGGLVSINGTLASEHNNFEWKGDIKAEQLKLAKNGTPAKIPVDFNFDVRHDAAAHTGSLSHGDVGIGKAKASLTGTYNLGEKETLLNMKLAAPAMAVQELTEMLPALAVELPRGSSLQGGTLNMNFAVAGPLEKLDIKGALAVKGTRLANFDLGSKMTTIAKIAGIKVGPNTDFENISADVHDTPQGIDLQNITVIATDIGDISGAGTVSPTNTLDFKMRAKIKGNGVVSALASNVPFSVEGPAADPKFVPDIKGMATGLANQELKSITGDGADVGKAATGILNLFKKKSN
ncbi:MAG TPA: AsmA family protein [Bryobacteraceae bacterium]|nr:AsmA family protein [Bryobacteraceae bacterium]